MKKRFFPIALAFTISGSLLFTSCIGSFGLFNKILAWNQTIDNKFVNEVVFVALNIVPVYGVSFIADLLVINSIEFWNGDNPIEVGMVKTVQGENGIYTVETLENGYHIENQAGNEMNLVYDKTTNTWSVVANDQESKLIKIEDGGNSAIVYLPNGDEQKVELSAQGMLAFRQSVDNQLFFATK